MGAETDINIIQIDNEKYYKVFSFLGNKITEPSNYLTKNWFQINFDALITLIVKLNSKFQS